MSKTDFDINMQNREKVEANYMTDLFRRHMVDKKITQQKLGEMVGYSHSTISYMMKKPVGWWRIRDVCKMQQALRCSEEDLIEAILKSNK